MGQNYVGEVPVNFTAWTKPPAMLYREHANRRMGRPRKLPRLKVKNNPPAEVRHIASYSPRFRDVVWQDYHVKDGHKGPMVWRAKRIPVWLRGEDGLPGAPHHLVAAYNVQEPEKVKYFISNAPPDTPVETLLLVALSRWKIERMFEDGKGELGMDHFEVRRFQSIRRHLILSCVSYLFLAEFHEAHRGEKSGVDALPNPHGDSLAGAAVDPRGAMLSKVRRVNQPATGANTTSQRQGPTQPSKADPASIAQHRDVFERPTHVSMEPFVAL